MLIINHQPKILVKGIKPQKTTIEKIKPKKKKKKNRERILTNEQKNNH